VPAESPAAEMVILDANILIRAVLGKRVRELLDIHSDGVRFFAPDTAFAEAREHLPGILLRKVSTHKRLSRCSTTWPF
jgi:hypothetical protein